MTNRLSVYWAPQHKAERPGDLEYIRQARPYDVLILDPGIGDVLDAHRASPDSEIVLRYWAIDDGRTDQNPEGVYGELRRDPVAVARYHVSFYLERIADIMAEAAAQGVTTLRREQLIAHGINEPDTNNLEAQINAYTVAACAGMANEGITFEALCFATGHPVYLVDGPGSDVDWTRYHPALEAIRRHGHYAVTHEYYNDLGIGHPSVYPWHIGRADKWMPRGCKRKVGEFGFEMLVNGRMDRHHGWRGIIAPDQYVADIDYYMAHVRDDVCSVRIF